jgi:hypothetical protein
VISLRLDEARALAGDEETPHDASSTDEAATAVPA